MHTMDELGVCTIKMDPFSSLKRAATAEDCVSPKKSLIDVVESSQHNLSPTNNRGPVVKFNSADMPPPRVPSPRKPLGIIIPPGNIRVNTMVTTKSPNRNEVSLLSGLDFFATPFEDTEFRNEETGNASTPKKNRLTKLARRPSTKFSPGSCLSTMQVVSEDENSGLKNAVSHDLGIPSRMISLLCRPIKCSTSDILTPGKENFLHTGVRTMSLESPEKSRKTETFKRPKNRDSYSPSSKRAKSVSYTDMMMGQRSILRPSKLKLLVIDESVAGIENEPPSTSTNEVTSDLEFINPKKIMRSQSESAIMHAVEQSEQDPLLIGDCSKRYILPLVDDGKGSELKHISGLTLSALIDGHYNDLINRYDIIDCRYPYEYLGGHIKGSVNLHTQKQMFEQYLELKLPKPIGSVSKQRHVLIFHCEFSSQRGPSMCRFLRGADRQCNKDSFPSLHYPELYILMGGYKEFFENHQEYCIPCLYTPMLDPDHAESLQLYRTKSRNELLKSNSSNQLKGIRQMSCKKFVL